MIRVVDLHKAFGENRVLRGIDLEVAKGSTYVILGGSGSGKTVLMKHVIGLLKPDRGSIRVDGVEISSLTGKELTEARQRFGMVFQGAALFDSMTVLDNVAFPLKEKRGVHLGADELRKVVVRGSKGRQPWMVGVQDPRASGYFAAFPLARRGAVATAGDYEHYFLRAGARFHDVLDPRTGVPARRCRSVTVLGKSADEAAGLAHAVFVLGADDGFALLQRLDQVEAIVVDDQNRVHITPGLLPDVRFRPPTDGR